MNILLAKSKYLYMHTYIHTYIRTYIFIYIYIYIYIYTCIYIYTYLFLKKYECGPGTHIQIITIIIKYVKS